MRRLLARASSIDVVEVVILFVCTFVVLWSFHPNLVFSNSLITGGDTGAHVVLPAFLRSQHDLLNLTPWYPGWFAGMPAYTYYFVLPDFVAVLLSYVIHFAVAFKIATILGSVLMPLSAYVMARLFRAPRPIPAALALATLPFLFDASYTIDGGNLFSTMAGEYAFSLSLSLAMVAIGLFARGMRRGRGYWMAALFLALTLFSHVLPWFFVIGAVGVMVVFELFARRGYGGSEAHGLVRGDFARPFRFALGAGLLSGGLSAWWLLPFGTSQRYTNSMGYTNDNVSSVHAVATTLGWFNATGGAGGDRWVIVLGAIGIVVAYFSRERLGMILATLCWLSVAGFVLDPQGVIWNERLIPFWYLTVHLTAGWLVGYLLVRYVDPPRSPVHFLGTLTSSPLDDNVRAIQTRTLDAEAVPTNHSSDDVWSFVGDEGTGGRDVDEASGSEPRRAQPSSFASRRVEVSRVVAGWGESLDGSEDHLDEYAADDANDGPGDVAHLDSDLILARREARRERRLGRATLAVFVLGLASVVPGQIPSLASALHLNTTGNQVTNWSAWNYSGYQGKPAWPEYHSLISLMSRLSHRYGCGRAMWEYSSSENRFGTPMALMLMPYWTNNCVDSMEGLFFESSPTAPYHFLDQAELSQHPSDPQVGLNYGALNVKEGVRHLQMLGVRYYVAFSASAIAQANADSQLQLIGSTRQWPAPGVRWEVYLVRHSEMVTPLDHLPNVLSHVSSRLSWLGANQVWWLNSRLDNVLAASSGPASWPRARSIRDLKVSPPLARVRVSDVSQTTQSISFRVSRPGVPVLVKISYFPRWHATGASGPYQVSPNLMVVVPTSHDVTLSYGSTPANTLGRVVSDVTLGVGIAVLYWYWRERRRRSVAALSSVKSREHR